MGCNAFGTRILDMFLGFFDFSIIKEQMIRPTIQFYLPKCKKNRHPINNKHTDVCTYLGQALQCYQCPCSHERINCTKIKTHDELCIEDGDYDYGSTTTCSINMKNPVCMMITKSKFAVPMS